MAKRKVQGEAGANRAKPARASRADARVRPNARPRSDPQEGGDRHEKPARRPRATAKTAAAQRSAPARKPARKHDVRAEAPRRSPPRRCHGSIAPGGRSTRPSRPRPRRWTWTVTDRPRGPAAPRWPRQLREHRGMTPTSPAATSTSTSRTRTSPARKRPAATTPTPDQDIVDDIGKALGVEYQDNEELKASDKVIERDKHRWELDPGVVGRLQGEEVVGLGS